MSSGELAQPLARAGVKIRSQYVILNTYRRIYSYIPRYMRVGARLSNSPAEPSGALMEWEKMTGYMARIRVKILL
jgi:hypothetical protein